jgi:hypothetical protein
VIKSREAADRKNKLLISDWEKRRQVPQDGYRLQKSVALADDQRREAID